MQLLVFLVVNRMLLCSCLHVLDNYQGEASVFTSAFYLMIVLYSKIAMQSFWVVAYWPSNK